MSFTPQGIDVARVEREFVRLLRLPENTSPSGVPAVRTAVLNLVAYAADARTMERITSTLAALVDHHPSRTIVAQIGDGGPTGIDARIHVDCQPMGTTGLKVCSEHVVLEASAPALRRLPNVVLPLLLSDLPVVFWWPGEPGLRDPFLFDMLAPAQRFVVDTVGFVHVERALIMLDALRRRPGVSVDLADLNWGRLLPWRELIAQFWDVAPWRTHLSWLDRIEIELTKPTPGRSNRPQALLLAGWLASRLKWMPQHMERRADGYKLTAKRRGGSVEVLIRITAGEAAGLRAVRFFRDRGRQAAFAVTAGAGDSATMTVQIGGVDTYQRTARIERLEEPELLAHDLDTATGETVFEDALGAAASFLRSS